MKYVPLFILALSQVILNVVLTYKRHDKISRVFTYFTLLLLGWTFINITLDYGLSHDLLGLDLEGKLVLVNALNRAGFLFGSILLVVIYHAVIVSQEVTDSEEARPIIWVGLWLAAASLLPIFSGEYYAANGMFAYHYGVASILYLPYTVALGWRIVKIATQKLRTDQTRLERKQTLTVLAAMFLSAVWGLIFIIILPLITQNDEYIFVGYLAPYIFTALMYYAIIWLGLLNFRQVIARSIGYLLSLAALGAVFILSLQLIVRFILRDNIATQEALLFAMVSFGSAAMFQPAKRFFDKLTNEIFYRDAYDSERVFNKLSRTLVSAYDLNDLLSAVAKLLAEELKVSFVAVQLKQHEVIGWPDEKIRQDVVTIERAYKIFSEVVSDDEDIVVTELLRNNDSPQLRSILRDSDLSVIMRVTSMGKRPKRELGYIVIGQKRSGNMFTKQDILVIQAVANEIQLAIQNALHFEEIQQFNATLQEKVEEQTRKYRMAN